ncbi:DUF1810 domain-containing protein [Singulisphaera sp. PoT]|uniref:DUF1810 domain-containing protein n=1 Tax=Singulisphaera sp. PoT TaxID=3411797 RepID=UPI003BF5A5AD
MGGAAESGSGNDPHDLGRFVNAQEGDYEQALKEVRDGRKESHWMWYIFPQIDGLGFSSMSRRYSIKSLAEAREYLEHPVLGPRLLECIEAAMAVQGRSAHQIFGSPDDMKLKSCATLFASVTPEDSPFAQLLDKYFQGGRCGKTAELIAASPG